MRSVGVVVEYNPFHNGHKFHLEETRRKTDADCVIAVMSGNFLQRGEPALVSKWARTKMALESGIDIVIELPYVFSTQKAEVFATGAISLLESIHCQHVCFGSEHGTIDEFLQTVEFMNHHSDEFNLKVKKYINDGNSYPKATSLAYTALAIDDTLIDLSKPNNILGYHYVKAIKDRNYHIKPHTIKRTSANYHDEAFTSASIASATSIRKALFEDEDISAIENYVPKPTYSHLKNYYHEYEVLHNWEGYFDLLKYKILSTSPAELKEIYEVEEGIENRLHALIREATSFDEFMKKVKTKRYTWTRLQRVCLHILTNTLKKDMFEISKTMSPCYIRLLGMTKVGRQYLNEVKKDIQIPIISRLAAYHDQMLQLDLKATHTYISIFPEPLRSNLLRLEYSTPPIMYDEDKNEYIN